jgi:ATP-binding cassette, subfamily B, bacterial
VFRTRTRELPAVPRERRGETARRIVGFFRPYRLEVAVVVVMILATSLLGLINPWLLGELIDHAIPEQDFQLLTVLVGLMIVVPIVSGVIGVGQSYLSNDVGQKVMRDLRNALYAHLQALPLRFFTETRTGEIQSRLANDVGGIQTVVTETAASTVSSLTTVISTIAFMLLLNWQLALLSIGVLPFFMYLTYRVGKVRRRVSGQTQKSLAEMSAITEESLSVSGILLSKTFGQQRTMVNRFRLENERLARLQVRQAMIGRWFFMIIGTVFSITPALVYFFAGVLIMQGDDSITVGEIVVFTTLQSRLFFPLGSLLSLQVEIQGALALFDRIFEYLDIEPSIRDRPGAIALDPATARGAVRFDHVAFRYPAAPPGTASAGPGLEPMEEGAGPASGVGAGAEDGRATGSATVLEDARAAIAEEALRDTQPEIGADELADLAQAAERSEDDRRDRNKTALFGAEDEPALPVPFGLEDVSFEVEPGQLVALVGPSGAGKTTTTYLIPRLYDADEGSVLIDGTNVRDLTLDSLGTTIGFVTQETYLFHSTIAENLRYGRPDATDEQVETAAQAAALHDRIMELPEGYDTVVGERGYRLSGGEKQRLAIARVLLKDPRILILDEATSALDTVSERLIQAALERLMEGRTTIAIAHRLSTILAADVILVFDRGQIVERGRHAELVAKRGLYARLYHEQFVAAAPPPASGASAATAS